jgi:hypothetical protein
MLGSEKAQFGRSKQKRNDRRLIGLAISIDELSFVRSSQFYTGNIGEPTTFKDLLIAVSKDFSPTEEKPLFVMDAGIATNDNLEILRSKNYDYVCVSRVIPKKYSKLNNRATTITDNRGNQIHLSKIEVQDSDDYFLQVKSDQKELKEKSMDSKLTKRFENQLTEIKEKLQKKRTLKKISKIHEKVGAIKARLSRIGWLYEIQYTEDQEKDIVLDLNWKRTVAKEKPKGEYFLRYTKGAINEQEIWNAYNLTRDVEAVFRCLKTDLNIRPIHHQKDAFIESHIWLGILAYQLVNYITIHLKTAGINHSWTTIVNKMRSMQSATVTVNNEKNEKLYIKVCTRPTKEQKDIFNALNYKHRPFVRKTKVVTQM